MDGISRITPEQLSREQIDSHTIQARYKAGYGIYDIKSKFIGNKSLCDLLYEIILRKQKENFCPGRHDS